MTDKSDNDTDLNPYVVDDIDTAAEHTMQDVEFGDTSEFQNKIIDDSKKMAAARASIQVFKLQTFTWSWELHHTPQGQPHYVQTRNMRICYITYDGKHFYLQYEPFMKIENNPSKITRTYEINAFYAYKVNVYPPPYSFEGTDEFANKKSNHAWVQLAVYLTKEYRDKNTQETVKPPDQNFEIPFVYFEKLYAWYKKMKRNYVMRQIKGTDDTPFTVENFNPKMFDKKVSIVKH